MPLLQFVNDGQPTLGNKERHAGHAQRRGPVPEKSRAEQRLGGGPRAVQFLKIKGKLHGGNVQRPAKSEKALQFRDGVVLFKNDVLEMDEPGLAGRRPVAFNIGGHPCETVHALDRPVDFRRGAVQADVDAALAVPQQSGNGRGKAQGIGMHVLRPAVMQNPSAGFLKVRQNARFAAAPAEKAIPAQDLLLFKAPEHRQNGVARAVASPQIAIHASAIAQMPVHIDADRPEQQPRDGTLRRVDLDTFRTAPAHCAPFLQLLHDILDMPGVGGHIQPAARKRKARHGNGVHIAAGLHSVRLKINVIAEIQTEFHGAPTLWAAGPETFERPARACPVLTTDGSAPASRGSVPSRPEARGGRYPQLWGNADESGSPRAD